MKLFGGDRKAHPKGGRKKRLIGSENKRQPQDKPLFDKPLLKKPL